MDVVVTETSCPDRIGANTDNKGSALCLTERIWGTESAVVATRLWSFLAANLLRWLEKSESEANEG